MAVQDFVSFDFVILNFFQVKARTPLKRLMRSKGALKDQSRLIQHFTKELQTANFRTKQSTFGYWTEHFLNIEKI